MINSNLKFKTVTSDQLFYGLYQYSASFQLQECWVFRYTLEHDQIDERLTRQQEWREKMRQRWPSDQMNRYHSMIDDITRANTHVMADFITAIKDPYKIIIENKVMRIYTNDLALINQIDQLTYVQKKRYAQAVVNRPKDTIRLKKSKHQLRSYFKETRISPEDKQAIAQFLTGQKDVRVGAGLQAWLDEKRSIYITKWTRDYFFVDYTNPSWLTMLNLVRPGLIRKTVAIIAK